MAKKATLEQTDRAKPANRAEALDLAIEEILKAQGEGSIMRGTKRVKCDVISTGASVLDAALGTGGIPRGRITEIYGPESSGKTTLALTVAANAQKMGGVVAFIDAEHALDPVYASNIGVDMDKILISQPDSGEQALEIADRLAQSGAVDVIVIDSVAALVPKAELEGNMGDAVMGAQARLMSQALRKLKGVVHRTNTALIFINQLREKIGIIFGSNETTTGGRALKFYASVRIDIRSSKMPSGNGNLATTKIVKNKLAPPFKTAQFEIVYGKGINRAGCVIDQGVEFKLIEKRGSFFSYGQLKLGNGKENASKCLEDNEDILMELEKLISQKMDQIKNLPSGESPAVAIFNEEADESDEVEDNQED